MIIIIVSIIIIIIIISSSSSSIIIEPGHDAEEAGVGEDAVLARRFLWEEPLYK